MGSAPGWGAWQCDNCCVLGVPDDDSQPTYGLVAAAARVLDFLFLQFGVPDPIYCRSGTQGARLGA